MRAKIRSKKPTWVEIGDISPVKIALPSISFKTWGSGRLMLVMNGVLRKYLHAPIRVQMLLNLEEKEIAIVVAPVNDMSAKRVTVRGTGYTASFSQANERDALKKTGLLEEGLTFTFLPEHEESIPGEKAVFSFR